jgi:hypothetical protein
MTTEPNSFDSPAESPTPQNQSTGVGMSRAVPRKREASRRCNVEPASEVCAIGQSAHFSS